MENRRRRESEPGSTRGELLRARLFGWVPRQSQFSLVTAALSGVLFITMIADLAVGHTHFNHQAVIAWTVSYFILTCVPISLGARTPEWLGVMLVGYLTFWSSYSLFHTQHSHMELNALLESPMVAVYLGWFYRQWLARAVLAVNLISVSVAALLRPEVPDHAFSSPLALLYNLCIAGICIEAAIMVRTRADSQANKDPLTGVLNRRGLVEFGNRLIALSRTNGDPLSLAVVDFDDFKAVNDRGGHALGDEALRTVSAAWLDGLDQNSLVARTGGDEFVLMIRATKAQATKRLAALHIVSPYPWTWGLVEFSGEDTFDDLVMRADAELYDKKRLRDS